MGSVSQGCSWLFQNSSSKLPQPTFVVYMASSHNKITWDEKLNSSKLFSAVRDTNNKYVLTLNKFSKENEGYYFCSVISNSVMYFSSVVPVLQKGLEVEVPVSWVLGVTSEQVSRRFPLLKSLGASWR